MEVYVQLLIYLAPIAIGGLVACVWGLWNSHHKLKLHIVEYYLKKSDLADIKKEVRNLTHMMYMIAGKLGVPINNPEGDK